VAAAPLRAQEPAPIAIESYTLENGLDVILAPERGSQVVAVNIVYAVGSRDEQPGRTGFAHLFEHMMFKGSKNVGHGEHMRLVSRAGGEVNAQTGEDRTLYWQVLPPNQLKLWLEAERMRSLEVTPEKFDNQRAAVKEEVRLKVENPPYARGLADAYAAIADPETCFGYAHSAFGSMADLDAARVEDARAFFARYYVPNNATLAVVGDFDAAAAKRLIDPLGRDRGRELVEVVGEVLAERGLMHQPEQRAVPAPPLELLELLELLEPARHERRSDVRVRGRHGRARRDQRLAPAADVRVVAEVAQ
jgi:predicted Zn-dependent peptidase